VGYMPCQCFQGTFSGEGRTRGYGVRDQQVAVGASAPAPCSGLAPSCNAGLRLEIGLGVDHRVGLGQSAAFRAYGDPGGGARRCRAALQPAVTGPDSDGRAAAPYCEQAFDSAGKPIPTSSASAQGAQYDVRNRGPPIMLLPLLPHIALHFHHRGVAIAWRRICGGAVLAGGVRASHSLASAPLASIPRPCQCSRDEPVMPEPAPAQVALHLGWLGSSASCSNRPHARSPGLR
jgi:hypothetical protein